MVTREGALVRKWNGEWSHRQVFQDIAAGSSITDEYIVPSNRVFIPEIVVTGSQHFYKLRITLTIDNTIVLNRIRSSSALEHLLPLTLIPCKNKMTIKVENEDTETRTADLIVWGFLIPLTDLSFFLREIRQDHIIDYLDAIAKGLQVKPTIVAAAPVKPPGIEVALRKVKASLQEEI
jgi:hypothetical protein